MFLPFQSAAADICNSDNLIAKCDALAKLGVNINGAETLGMPKYSDGSIIYNGVGKGQLSTTPPSSSQVQNAETLTKELLNAAKEVVTENVRSEFWTAEQKAMVARLGTVRVRTGSMSDASCKAKKGKGADANAYYDPFWHELVMCPATTRLARPQLLMLMAHEIGHVISPCAMGKTFSDVTPLAANKNAVEQCFRGSKTQLSIAKDYLAGGRQIVISGADLLRSPYKETVSKMKDCGLINARASESNFGSETFKPVSACLEKSYAATFEDYKKFRVGKAPSPQDPLETSPQIKCLGAFEEHFAEAFGAKLFGKALESATNTAETAKVGLTQMTSYACGAKANKRPTPPEALFQYPRSVDRVHIQMSDPNVQAALSCRVPKSSVCTFEHEAPNASRPQVSQRQDGRD